MLFTSSWFYDGYIYLRDGIYPATWFSNLLISPALYITAGLFWSLEWEKGKGTSFVFQKEDWYLGHTESSFRKMVWITFPFMAFAAYGVIWFVWHYFR